MNKMTKAEFVSKFTTDKALRRKTKEQIADSYHLSVIGKQRTKQRRMRKQRMAR